MLDADGVRVGVSARMALTGIPAGVRAVRPGDRLAAGARVGAQGPSPRPRTCPDPAGRPHPASQPHPAGRPRPAAPPGPDGRVAVVDWAGPWPVDEAWWAPAEASRRVRFQLTLADGRALLVCLSAGAWTVEAVYD